MERSSTKALQRLETVMVMLVLRGDSSYQLCEALSRRGLLAVSKALHAFVVVVVKTFYFIY